MAKQAFICEKCFSPYETKESAENCESLHCDTQHIKVQSVAWEPTEWAPSEVVLGVEHKEPFEGQVSRVRYVRVQEP